MNSKKILIKNFSSLSLLQVSNYIFPLITLPYLLRVLGPEKYGLMNFASAFVAYFGILTDYGFNLSIPKEASIHRDNLIKLSEIFSSVLIIKVFIFIISSAIFVVIILTLPKFYLDKEIYLLSFISVLGQLFFPAWFFQGIEKMHFIPFITITIRSFAVVLIFLFINSPQDLNLLILINSISFVCIGIFSIMIILKKFSIRFNWQKIRTLKYYLREGFHLFTSSLSISLYTTSTIFILGLIAGDKFVGYYSAADKVRFAVQNLFSSLTQTIYPHLANIFKSSITEGLIFIKKIIKTAGPVVLILCALIFIFSEQIIVLVAGSGYTESVLVLRIISFLPFIIFLSNMAGIQIMINLGYQKAFTLIVGLGAAISIILSLILVPFYNELGTAITLLITELFVTIAMIIFIKNRLKINAALEIEK